MGAMNRMCCILMLCIASVAAVEPIPWTMPLDGGDGVVDLSALNHAPAGVRGRVAVRDGRFVLADSGERIRFLGVALTFAAAFPEPEVAAAMARRLARLGINAVRLHYIDGGTAGRFGRHSIWDPAFPREPRLDPAQLARLDRLLYELKAVGIYVCINLKVGRTFDEADGLPAGYLGEGAARRIAKGADLVDPRLIALQREYARDLLTHVNPLTGLAYGQDPGVMAVELNNENSLVLPNRAVDSAAAWPAAPAAALRAAWNAWLQRRYADRPALAAAWSGGGDMGPELPMAGAWQLERHAGAQATIEIQGSGLVCEMPAVAGSAWHIQAVRLIGEHPAGTRLTLAMRARADRIRPLTMRSEMGASPWSNRGLDATVPLTTEWREVRLPWTVNAADPPLRLVLRLGEASGRVEIADLRLLAGHAPPALPDAASFAAGAIGLPVAPVLGQREDWLRFLVDTERAYARDMTAFVRGLGVAAPVVCGQISWGAQTGLHRGLDEDYIDDHQYWDHPQRGWRDPRQLLAHGRPLSAELDRPGAVSELARLRVAGMPFSVSEFNHCAPNPHRAEAMPVIAAVAALQDWDALVLHEYGAPPAPLAMLYQPFEVGSDPAIMAYLPAAALAFRQGAIGALAAQELRPVPGAYAPGRDGRPADAWDGAAAAERLLRVRIGLEAGRRIPDWLGGSGWAAPGSASAAVDAGRFICAGPSLAILAGRIGGRASAAAGMTARLDHCSGDHGALVLAALDGRPLAASRRMLLTAMAGTANTGMVRKADGSGLDDWGRAPVLAEPLAGNLELPLAAGLRAWALDPSGRPLAEAVLEGPPGAARLRLRHEDRTVWWLLAEAP